MVFLGGPPSKLYPGQKEDYFAKAFFRRLVSDLLFFAEIFLPCTIIIDTCAYLA